MQYRLLAHRLRLQYGPGRPDVVAERPRQKRTGVYLDSDEAPTLVDVTGAEVGFDLGMALAAGVLVPFAPPTAGATYPPLDPAPVETAATSRRPRTKGGPADG